MHRYKQIEYKAGMTIEVIKCIPREGRKGAQKEKVTQKTPEEIREANMKQAARKLARKINANFRPGDWYVTLTYRKDDRPDPETAALYLKRFLADLRKEYKKYGFELRYIQVTEYKRKAIHHHLILNNVNNGKKTTTDFVRLLWKGRGNPKFVGLYDDGEYSKLADYFIKETEKTFREGDSPVRQRYSCSRNLINPKPTVRTRKAKTWKQDPKPRPGYYIQKDSLYNGFDRLGYRYQRYVMVKLEPDDSDWEGSGYDERSWAGGVYRDNGNTGKPQ